jgi:hypothetical protein
MTITMDDSRITSIAQLKEFAKMTKGMFSRGSPIKEVYEWVGKTLGRFKYFSLRKKEKTVVKGYLMDMTGLSDAQMTRLIKRKLDRGVLLPSTTKKHSFPTTYTTGDILTLAETDNAHSRISGPATRAVFEREYALYENKKYERLKKISTSHLYTLRGTKRYRSHSFTYSKTNPTGVAIGVRRKPNPNGKPGYLRVDSVHQGDLNKEKGVYHINMTDEVTQWEIVGCVEGISEYFLEPLLIDLLAQFPFIILNFHSDNGSEYINHVVAHILNKLMIEQTKSRSRHSEDNALVEGKNGAIVRKHMGYAHIPKKNARDINEFYKTCFNEYLAYHRPCGFATLKIDCRGKEKKVYNTYLTPFRKFLSLPNPEQYLKPGITLEQMYALEQKMSDNDYAAHMQKEKQKLFARFTK